MGIPVLQIKDNEGNVIPIPAIKGESGLVSIELFSNANGSQRVIRYNDGTQIIIGKSAIETTSSSLIQRIESDYYFEKISGNIKYGEFERPFTEISDYWCEYSDDITKFDIQTKITDVLPFAIMGVTYLGIATQMISVLYGNVHYVILGRWK